MDWARGFRAWLFPVLLGISALLHFVMARSFLVHLGPQKIEFARGETTEVFLIEETPPLLEPILEPITEAIPEPESPPEIPAPPNADEILTTNQSEEVAAAEPTPELKKTEKKPVPQGPKSVSASKKANIPQPAVILNTPPNYPETARRAGWEGRVTVRVGGDQTLWRSAPANAGESLHYSCRDSRFDIPHHGNPWHRPRHGATHAHSGEYQ